MCSFHLQITPPDTRHRPLYHRPYNAPGTDSKKQKQKEEKLRSNYEKQDSKTFDWMRCLYDIPAKFQIKVAQLDELSHADSLYESIENLADSEFRLPSISSNSHENVITFFLYKSSFN